MGIKIKMKKHLDIPVFKLFGRISGGDAIKLSKKLEAFIKKPHDRVILDLSEIDFIDSNWLGVFVYSFKLYQDNNKDLIFYITPGFVKDIFYNASLQSIATIVESLDDI